jgi:allantoicase
MQAADAVAPATLSKACMRPGLIDLASSRVGGRALLASDEFFAPKSSLLKPGRGVFIEGKYTTRGKWMDGWETRRRRTPGHDWCIIRLGVPGVVRTVTVDTHHFRGNNPEACSINAAAFERPTKTTLLGSVSSRWPEILPRSPLQGDVENEIPVKSEMRVTHVRFNIFPDGGVARLRLWGEARPDWARIRARRGPVNLIAIENGGVPLAASDEFFSEPINLLMPGRPADMGDGWETRRRRGPGHDWVIVRLGARGEIDEVEVDTTHFKGNFPESCRLEGCDAPDLEPTTVPDERPEWRELLGRTKLQANSRHRFRAVGRSKPVTHVRFSISPDGGVARLRVLGKLVE